MQITHCASRRCEIAKATGDPYPGVPPGVVTIGRRRPVRTVAMVEPHAWSAVAASRRRADNLDDLRRVLAALRTLTGPIDVEHTGPSKQHPLCRPTIRRDG